MRLILVFVGAIAAFGSNPFNGLGKLPALKGFEEGQAQHRQTPPGATLVARASFSEGARRLTIEAFSYGTAKEVPQAIHSQSLARQGASVPIRLPELEKRGFEVHYVGQPRYIESDVVVGRIWVQIGLVRGDNPKYGVMSDAKLIAAELRSESKNDKLFKDLLPEIERLAKIANAATGD
ncbi:MAG: hypothetical protein P4L46_02015 [Fimbriimonas sp.]|nr:hypothetical protein [Fimbriimonas sp.]